MGFRALGLDTYPVTSVEEARKTVHNLAKTDCAVIAAITNGHRQTPGTSLGMHRDRTLFGLSKPVAMRATAEG